MGANTMRILLPIAMMGLTACATAPENIAAAQLSGNAFAAQNCSSLGTSLLSSKQNLENLSAQQRDAASGDALGVFLIGLPVSSMSGGDKEAQISITKAEIQQIETAMNARGCN